MRYEGENGVEEGGAAGGGVVGSGRYGRGIRRLQIELTLGDLLRPHLRSA